MDARKSNTQGDRVDSPGGWGWAWLVGLLLLLPGIVCRALGPASSRTWLEFVAIWCTGGAIMVLPVLAGWQAENAGCKAGRDVDGRLITTVLALALTILPFVLLNSHFAAWPRFWAVALGLSLLAWVFGFDILERAVWSGLWAALLSLLAGIAARGHPHP